MLKLRPEDPRAVLPFAKWLLGLSGFRQESEQLGRKILFNLFIYVAVLLVPKVCFPYPDVEALIRGLSELIFFTNIYVGLFCFILQHRHYRELLNAIDTFVKEVYPSSHQPESPAEQILIKLNRKINTISVIYCCYLAVAAFMYWLTPCMITTRSIYRAGSIAGNASIRQIEFFPNLEETFYWLDNRDSVFGYAVFSVVAFIVFVFAVYNHVTKILTILSTIKYCSTLLQLVNLGIDGLNHATSEVIDRELKRIIQMHQLAISCVTLLNRTLSFVMALQLAMCILTWCFTSLYILIVGLDVTAMMGLLIMINMTPEMFGYCFFGTELTTIGTMVSRQSYEF
uniref:Uncharacterized protein n=1 Tax=Anopheles christyi TaxID=43041 RepID=A0A182KHM7_9DIPT